MNPAPDWDKGGGLLPAIVQHWASGEVLMLGYMNAAALAATEASGRVTFFSRSRGRLWAKGETSGNWLELRSLHLDCDRDSLLVLAAPHGPTCHRGSFACFDEAARPAHAFLGALDRLVGERRTTAPADSYTAGLFAAGTRRIAQKLGEEGVETALAAVAEDDDALLGEAADLVYHLLVLLHARGTDLAAVATRLQARHAPRG